jgi:hypothetical protein
MVRFINLTPHVITIVGGNEDSKIISIPPSGEIARVSIENQLVFNLEGIEIYRAQYGQVEGLPAPEENTVFIVSTLVRARVPERLDVASPGNLVRNDAGQPIGCRGLVIN